MKTIVHICIVVIVYFIDNKWYIVTLATLYGQTVVYNLQGSLPRKDRDAIGCIENGQKE